MTHKISVVLAAYHGEKYIAEQLNSLFQQTLLPDEILIGDDSEDDATARAVESVRPNYNGKLCYIRNLNRLGVVGNFVNLVKLASGDLIFFCDQDDIWLPEKIEVLTQMLETEPNAQVVACNSMMVNEKLNTVYESLLSYVSDTMLNELEKKVIFQLVLFQKVNFSGHNMAMKHSFKEIFLKVPSTYRYHDIWLAQTAALQNSLYYVNKELTSYRIHANNASAPVFRKKRQSFFHRLKETFSNDKDLKQTFLIIECLYGLMQNTSGIPQENRLLLERYYHYLLKRKNLRSRKRPLRFFALTPALLRDYFQIGTGWRAFLRDQIL